MNLDFHARLVRLYYGHFTGAIGELVLEGELRHVASGLGSGRAELEGRADLIRGITVELAREVGRHGAFRIVIFLLREDLDRGAAVMAD